MRERVGPGDGQRTGEGRALREGTALRSGGRAVPSDSRNSESRGECGPWRIPQEVLGSCERAKSGPVWTQDAAPELRCRRLPRDSVLSPFLPSHAFFLRSLGPEASPTVACDPPARARASCHGLLPGRALCLLWPVWGHDKGAFHQRAW